MKGLDKITNIALAEILSHNDIISTEKITDALYSQDRSGHPFVEILIKAGYVSEWDLGRIITEHFNLPFLLASSYQLSRDAQRAVPETLVLDHNIVPLDQFDQVLVVAMPLIAAAEALEEIQKACGHEVFPYVGLASDNRKVLHGIFPQVPTEQIGTRRKRATGGEAAGSWTNLFDQADEMVKKGLGKD